MAPVFDCPFKCSNVFFNVFMAKREPCTLILWHNYELFLLHKLDELHKGEISVAKRPTLGQGRFGRFGENIKII